MAEADDFDSAILAIAARQDRAAFARLFSHFAPRIKTFLIRAGLPANIAEDLAQESLLSVWRKAHYFDPSRAKAATWIFTIARNLRIDHLRRMRLPSTLEPDPSEIGDDHPSSELLLITAEREIGVRNALKQLSPEQATIVRLSFFEEKPHSQIASELGLPLGTVKSRVRLALNRLRTLLDDVA